MKDNFLSLCQCVEIVENFWNSDIPYQWREKCDDFGEEMPDDADWKEVDQDHNFNFDDNHYRKTPAQTEID